MNVVTIIECEKCKQLEEKNYFIKDKEICTKCEPTDADKKWKETQLYIKEKRKQYGINED